MISHLSLVAIEQEIASLASKADHEPFDKAEERRATVIRAKKKAIISFEPKSGPAWAALLALLILDTKDVRPNLQEMAFQGLGGGSLCSTAKKDHCRHCQDEAIPYANHIKLNWGGVHS